MNEMGILGEEIMSDFIFIFLSCGVFVITIAWMKINISKKNKKRCTIENQNTFEDKSVVQDEDNYMTMGMSLGMCFGVAIGSSLMNTFGINALTYGICFGMLVGMLVGIAIKKK